MSAPEWYVEERDEDGEWCFVSCNYDLQAGWESLSANETIFPGAAFRLVKVTREVLHR